MDGFLYGSGLALSGAFAPAPPKGEPLAVSRNLAGELPVPLPLGEVASRRDDGEGELLYQNTLPTAYRLLTRSSRYSGSAGSRLLMTTPPLADAPVEWM